MSTTPKIGWRTKGLSELSSVFTDGDWIEKKDQSIDGIRLIQTGNIGNGLFKDRAEKSRYVSEKTFKKLKCTEVFESDCLVSRLPDPVGRACIVPVIQEKLITAVDCTIIRFNNIDILNNWFIYYSLSQEYQNQINKEISGSTRQRISKKNLAQIQVPLPPLPEQQHIVTILDEAFVAIEKAKKNTEKNLESAKEIFESYLQSAFSNDTWEAVSLAQVCEISSKLIDPREYRYSDLLHVGAGNIEIKSGRLLKLQTAIDERLISGKFLFDKSMVLYSKIRPYLMKVARPDFSGLCSADIYPLSPNPNKVIRDYLYYLLLTSDFTHYAIKGSGRAGMPKVNRDHLFSYKFNLAPLAEQQIIVSKLNMISQECKKLESLYQQKIAGLEELKKSLLKKAFAGEL